MNLFVQNDYNQLLRIASQSIIHGAIHGSPISTNPQSVSQKLRADGKTFVSVMYKGKLNGCMGNVNDVPLFISVADNAFRSAFKDSRFRPIREHNYKDLSLKIHHLYHTRKVKCSTMKELCDAIKPLDTLTISYEKHSASMLAEMQTGFGSKQKFVEETIKKMGMQKAPEFSKLSFTLHETYISKIVRVTDYL